jgi:hypothetical protein
MGVVVSEGLESLALPWRRTHPPRRPHHAFSNQWGGSMREAVEGLRRHLGLQGIEVSEAGEG